MPLVLLNIFYFISKLSLFSFSCQTCFVNSVLFLYLILLKSLIWFLYLSLDVAFDSPIYLFISPSDSTELCYYSLSLLPFHVKHTITCVIHKFLQIINAQFEFST